MKPFEFYLKKGEVRKIKPDENEGASLLNDATLRYEYFSIMDVTDKNAKFVFENLYESLREILDSILLRQGYRSYSHQASIVYAKGKLILSERDAVILDELRELRNRSKYYGQSISAAFAADKISEAKRLFNKLNQPKPIQASKS